jgi:tetratricopeptide (TPR) repeat protein
VLVVGQERERREPGVPQGGAERVDRAVAGAPDLDRDAVARDRRDDARPRAAALGLVLEAEGNKKEARRELEKALELDPRLDGAKERLRKLRLFGGLLG